MSRANELTKAITKLLNLNRCFVWRQNNGAVYDARKKIFRAGSSKKGVPDIVGVTGNGTFIGVEVKSGKDKMSAEQKQFKAEIERRGGIYIEARTIEDVVENYHWVAK